jgi:hypothetical protein
LVDGGYAAIWKKDHGLPLNDENSKYTKPVMANLKRWEEVPDRREMFTDDMLEEFYKWKTTAQPDSLDDCFYDWLGIGRYTGFRRSEWAQERKHSYKTVVELNAEARAMIDGDWLFFDERGYLLDKSKARESDVFKVNITWRYQKNGNNGEVISFWRDDVDPRWCPVRAAWRICNRARRLHQPLHEPLGKYVDYKMKKVAYINTAECEIYLRDVAKTATGILDDKILQKLFGMHSFQVTACNELARLGVEDSFIKRRLRWTSEAFLVYLRNNVYMARRHNLFLTIKAPTQDVDFQQSLPRLGGAR